MSRLLDKIKKQSETPAAQMGFRKTLPAGKPPTILCIARITIPDTETPLKKVEGADAVLLDFGGMELTAKNLKKITDNLGDIPWGIILEQSANAIEKLEDAGCDFMLLSPTSSVAGSPKHEKTGKIMQVESSMDDGLIMALNKLPVDAVLADETFGEAGVMSYHHLMRLGYLALIVKKPLIVSVPLSISKDELKALWDAGIEAVLSPVDIIKGENLKALGDMASSLPPREKTKQKKMGVLLPRSGEQPAEPIPDEEEEDE